MVFGGRPWAAFVLGLAAMILLLGIAASGFQHWLATPKEPRHVTVAEAATGTLGRTWVVLDDARFRHESKVELPSGEFVETVIPVTDPGGKHVLQAHVKHGTVASSGLVEPEYPVYVEKLAEAHALRATSGPQVRFEPGWTPGDDLFETIFMAAFSPFAFLFYPVLLFASRKQRPRDLPSTWSIRGSALVPLLLGGVVLFALRGAPMWGPLPGVFAAADVALGLALVAFAHTSRLKRLLGWLDRVQPRGETPPAAVPPPQPEGPGPAPPGVGEHALEPELVAPPPRELAPSVKRGPYARGLSRGAWTCSSLGLGCILLGLSGVLDRLAYYVLPLGYLVWFGAGLVLVGGGIAVFAALRMGRLRYATHGVAFAARVEAIEQAVSRYVNGVPTTYVYFARIRFVHPETGAEAQWTVRSPEVAKETATPVKPGDVRTAVYLPGKPDSTTLYGFLRLTAESSLLVDPKPKLPPILGCAAALALLALCVGALYALTFFEPENMDPKGFAWSAGLAVPLAVVAAVLAGRRKGGTRGQAVLAAFLVLVFGTLFWVIALTSANAVFDRSEPEYRVVTVKRFWNATYVLVVRTYSVEYEDPLQPSSPRYPVTIELAERLRGTAAIEIRKGFFGWRWVAAIYPVRRMRDDGSGRVEIEVDRSHTKEVTAR